MSDVSGDPTARRRRPLGSVLLVLVLGWSLMTTCAWSQPVRPGLEGIISWFVLAPALGVVWSVLVGVRLFRRTGLDHRWWPLWVTPVLVVVTALSCWVDAPFRLRWEASAPAFREVGGRLDAGARPADLSGTWVGAYRVRSAEWNSEGLVEMETWNNGVISVGFAYSPGRELVSNSVTTYFALDNSWYGFSSM